MTTTPDFRALLADDAYAASFQSLGQYRTALLNALATPPPELPTGQIIFNAPPPEEIIRLNKEGFHYKGQFIADAGEAHRLMLVFLKQHAKAEPEPPTDEELDELAHQCEIAAEVNNDPECLYSGDRHRFARAVLERWGHG
jgi:hypothetical protein